MQGDGGAKNPVAYLALDVETQIAKLIMARVWTDLMA